MTVVKKKILGVVSAICGLFGVVGIVIAIFKKKKR